MYFWLIEKITIVVFYYLDSTKYQESLNIKKTVEMIRNINLT